MASTLPRVARLLIAQALRVVVALCLGLAIVASTLTLVGLALAATGSQRIGHLGYLVAMTVGVVVLLLALGRLAHIALARVAHLEPPPTPPQ